jgi:hypothetical protein
MGTGEKARHWRFSSESDRRHRQDAFDALDACTDGTNGTLNR